MFEPLNKKSLVMHPFSVQANSVPGESRVESSNLQRNFLNISIDGTNIPEEPMQNIHVVSVPLSALVIAPAWCSTPTSQHFLWFLGSGESSSFIHIKYPTSIHLIFMNSFVQDTEKLSNSFLAETSSSATEFAPG
jgi:hypothetical protein